MTISNLSIRCFGDGARWVRVFVAMGMTAATACAPSPEPTHQTVDYYRANKEAREAKVAECANDPGALGRTPDCINAKQAASIEDIGNLRDLPPMGLLKDGEDQSGENKSTNGSSNPQGTDNSPGEAQ